MLINCPNCGAPLSSDGYCSYCQTKVRYANELEMQMITSGKCIQHILPTEVLIKLKADDDTMIIIPFIGKPENITITYNESSYYAHDHLINKVQSTPTINMEWTGSIINKEAMHGISINE